jgi:hypothetical protein
MQRRGSTLIELLVVIAPAAGKGASIGSSAVSGAGEGFGLGGHKYLFLRSGRLRRRMDCGSYRNVANVAVTSLLWCRGEAGGHQPLGSDE